MRGSQSSFCAWVPPASSARARISGRVIRLPAAASEAALSASAHRQHQWGVVGFASAAAKPLGDREPEHTHVAHRPEQAFGHSQVLAMNTLGLRRDDIGGEAAERLGGECGILA